MTNERFEIKSTINYKYICYYSKCTCRYTPLTVQAGSSFFFFNRVCNESSEQNFWCRCECSLSYTSLFPCANTFIRLCHNVLASNTTVCAQLVRYHQSLGKGYTKTSVMEYLQMQLLQQLRNWPSHVCCMYMFFHGWLV